MSLQKPWSMYKNTYEIGQAIQKGLADRLELPVGLAVEEEENILIVLKLPQNEAHIRFSLIDLKSLHSNAEEFVAFIEETWKESKQAQ